MFLPEIFLLNHVRYRLKGLGEHVRAGQRRAQRRWKTALKAKVENP